MWLTLNVNEPLLCCYVQFHHVRTFESLKVWFQTGSHVLYNCNNFDISDLLSSTVKAAPQSLMDCLPKVREALDYLSYLPPLTAHALLKAIHPLLKISMNLKDSLVLVLRKAMFSK